MTPKIKRVFFLSLAGFLILVFVVSLSSFFFKNPPQEYTKEDFYFTHITKVIDGDTVEIEGGYRVRYIGIDTPEKGECFYQEATQKNKELVEGKEVKLERDILEIDEYDRLLYYIWIDDVLINEYLIEEGYAYSSPYPPNVKYLKRLEEAQEKAEESKKGLWLKCD